MNLVLELDALLLPLGEHALNLSLHGPLLVLDLLAYLFKLLHCLLVCALQMTLLTIVLLVNLRKTLFVLKTQLHYFLTQYVHLL